jgi:hypothetical protein
MWSQSDLGMWSSEPAQSSAVVGGFIAHELSRRRHNPDIGMSEAKDRYYIRASIAASSTP